MVAFATAWAMASANSSLKLAKELEQHELRFGALLTLLRSLFALSLATLPTPTA